MSLCLTIKNGQRLYIGDDIVVEVTKSKGSVGVAIDAPDHVRIFREGVEPTEPAYEKMEAGPCLTDEERTGLDDCNRGDAHAARPARPGSSVAFPIIQCLRAHGMPDFLSVNQIVDWLKVAFYDAETESKQPQALGERLPQDAAGNVKLPGDMMYGISPGGKIRKGEVGFAPSFAAYPGYRVEFGGRTGTFSSQQPTPVEECYSTIREAETAKEFES